MKKIHTAARLGLRAVHTKLVSTLTNNTLLKQELSEPQNQDFGHLQQCIDVNLKSAHVNV